MATMWAANEYERNGGGIVRPGKVVWLALYHRSPIIIGMRVASHISVVF